MKTIFINSRQSIFNNLATEEQIKKSLNHYQRDLSDLQKQSEDRWQRYMNCQDDTIIGGLSDQINSERLREVRKKIDILSDQIEGNIKVNVDYVYVHFLISTDGILVSTRCFNGEYGICFITNEHNGIKKFISLAKRQETFRKKGVLICEGKIKRQYASYLHTTEGFVRVLKYGAIVPSSFKYGRVRQSVSIVPHLEDLVKKIDPKRWIKFIEKNNY